MSTPSGFVLNASTPIQTWLEVAGRAERDGYILKAFSLYRAGSQHHPESKELAVATERLRAAIEAGEKDGSILVDRQPTAPRDTPADVLFEQANVYLKYDLREKAIAQLRQLLLHYPDHAEARRTLSALVNDAGQSKDD